MTKQQADEFFDALHRLEKAANEIFGDGWGGRIVQYVQWTQILENEDKWRELTSLYDGAEPADAQPSEDPSNQNNQP